MDKTTQSLEGAVQAIADEDRFALNAHPSLDQLADHRAGRLSTDDDERLMDHLALCHMCTELLLDLASFPRLEPPEGVEPVSEQEVETAWSEMGPELLAAAGVEKTAAAEAEIAAYPSSESVGIRPAELAAAPALRAQDDATTPQGWWDMLGAFLYRLFAAPRFAYGLAAVLLLALPLTRYWTVHQLTRPDFNVPIMNLIPERRAPAAPESILIPAGAEQFLLVLNVVTPRAFTDYVVEVNDASEPDDRVRWRRDGLQPSAAGNFNLLIPGRFLPAGQYQIRLLGREGDTTEDVANYTILIAHESTSP